MLCVLLISCRFRVVYVKKMKAATVVVSFINAPSTQQRIGEDEGNITSAQEKGKGVKTINVMACR